MKVILHCGLCEPELDPGPIMGNALEATCAHCGSLVIRHRKWKPTAGGGILVGDDVFVCTPPEEHAQVT